MVIGIDGNEANVEKRVGINKYAFEIIKGIYNILPQNDSLIVYVYLKDKPLIDMPKERKNFRYKILSGGKIWILSRLSPHLLLNPEKLNVFFSPNHYIPPFTTIPTVCSIMDLGYLKDSAQFKKYDFWQLKYWTAWSIKRSKYIFTISKASSEDIVRQYPSSKEKIVITYPGYDEDLATRKFTKEQIEIVKKKYTIVNISSDKNYDYILYLGTLKPSKNIEGLIRAYHIANIKDIKLVIAGKKGWLYNSIFEIVKELDLEEKIVFTDFVEEKDKPVLIKGAKIFILPSFWEGFGMDILTAFSLGIPVIASNRGSLPEVVGEAGYLIDPHDLNSIAKTIRKVLSLKKEDYDKIAKKEKTQLSKFSWQKSAIQTLNTLLKAASN